MRKRKYGFFKEISNKDLIEYVFKYHKGKKPGELQRADSSLYSVVLKRKLIDKLVEKDIIIRTRRDGLFENMNDKQLIEYTKKNYFDLRPSELQTNDSSLYSVARERGLINKLVEKGIIRRTRRDGFFENINDNQLIKYISKHHKGKKISELENSDSSLYSNACERGLIDKLVKRGILIRARNDRNFRDKNNDELIKYISKYHKRKTITELQKDDHTLYKFISNKKRLIDKLVKIGILIRKKRFKGFFKNASNDKLINYTIKNYKGKAIVELQKNDPSLYNILRETNLINKLIEMGVLKRKIRPRGFFSEMSNEELIEYVVKYHKRKTTREFKKDGGASFIVYKRGLIDKLVERGILIRIGVKNKYLTNGQLEQFLREKPESMDIGSLVSITENASDVANILIKLYPDRFPSAAKLARALPGAVKRIGHSLYPFNIEKARKLRNRIRTLPSKVRYALDDLLYLILCDQYQKPFNQNPKKALEEITQFAIGNNGMRDLAFRVLKYFKSAYSFNIPGYGKIKDYT